MIHLLRIYNKNYWISIFGPILTFVFPIIFIWLVSSVYTFSMSGNSISFANAILPTALFSSLYIIFLVLLPQAVFEIKDSILIKQLKVSSIKLWHVLFAGALFYSFMAIASFFVSIIASIITANELIHDRVLWMYSQSNWWQIMYVLLINVLLGSSFGVFEASVLKRSSTINVTAIIVVFLSFLLAGLLVPIMLAPEQLKSVWIVSYFDPIRYATTQMYEAIYSIPSEFNLYGSSLFDVSTSYEAFPVELMSTKFTILQQHDKVLNMVIPYCCIAGFTTTSYICFKV